MRLQNALPTALVIGSFLGVAVAGVKQFSAPAEVSAVDAAGSLEEPAEPEVTWDIPLTRNESVERFVRVFGGTQTDRMALYLKRSGQYEGMIRSKLRERGMPEDLLYLSMIESGFNPTARSPAAAVGLWQFIAPTGRSYGLRIDSYVDERRDPEKSTDAALRYLQDLHRQFGSWYLAAAAYNGGAGRVSRVMREVTGRERGEEDDFWRIRHRLPRETSEYVPLILAAALVGKEPHKYGIDEVERMDPISTERVTVPGGVSLTLIARAAGTTEPDLRKLNPHLLRDVTPPGKEYMVRVPAGRSAQFAANFSRMRAQAPAVRSAPAARTAQASPARKLAQATRASTTARSNTRTAAPAARATHTVRQGESLSVIARRHGTSVSALQRANGMGSKQTTIRTGQRLRVPAR
jgi:membrane-bound lytic murein transglycosylase D